MNASALEPPSASQARYESQADGFTLHLPPRGFRAVWQSWLICVAVIAFVTLLTIFCWASLQQAVGWDQRLGLLTLFLICFFALRPGALLLTRSVLEQSLGHATVVVIGRQMYLHRRSALFCKESTWEATQIDALDEEYGSLKMLTNLGLVELFRERDPAEMRWLAQLLRHALDVPAEPEPKPGDVPIRMGISSVRLPLRGVLRSRYGKLELRTYFSGGPPLRFRLPIDPRRSRGLPLKREQIAWLPHKADQPALLIRLQHEIDEDLLIWCEDRDQLQEAIERFWSGGSA